MVGIEENPHAVREAKSNATQNGVAARTAFLTGRVEAILRSKAGQAALGALHQVEHDHTPLARDLAGLRRGGYRLDGVQPFDMFPQTGHIEALAIMRRADVPALEFPVVEASRA